MANMSYCRFQNTLSAMVDVQRALRDMDQDEFNELSEEERRAAIRLLRVCNDYAESMADFEFT